MSSTVSAPAPLVLALESSCDETACALVRGRRVLSSVVASQVELHASFGGVVPELASRHHLNAIVPLVREALARADVARLADVDAIAVTEGPGLVGALLIGVQMARGLAAVLDRPLIGVHHMEGHIYSALLEDAQQPGRELIPHVALLVSGGHTELVRVGGLGQYDILGATRDDAVGEAYDKVAKLLGLGYPGGPIVDQLAGEGDPTAITFPRSMIDRPDFEFSFSGLKTAVLMQLQRVPPQSKQQLADICASFQAAVVDILAAKSIRALEITALRELHVVGGVAANRGLRGRLQHEASQRQFQLVVPPLRYCGDNAAMIAAAGAARLSAARHAEPELRASIRLDDARLRQS